MALNRLIGDLNVEFIQGSILDIPSTNLGKFDLINSIGVLHHMQNYDQGLKVLEGSLLDDGVIVMMVCSRSSQHLDCGQAQCFC